ncbi:hypothetical protein F8O01_10020 [Pseudoclavibacter chungangensis]|uniref:Uncharacterized protein n=1 Tax=Pseudoclavibacter chungangensis TaxID=587635 RepID=A0A7J5BQZ9_9MICO|nr:hypothetical protein [Pseudoclavibacter chungangensis]KAB1656713.1 hypothetical protein F8O01_10020 [Pseudoclavibacter chungangensis]NYJ67832.1 hypothetical protein [Pseudoclavibacter chungangensis]
MRIRAVVRLHTRNPFGTYLFPFAIGGIAFAVILIVGLIAAISTNDAEDLAAMNEGMRWNGAVWAILGPLIGVGVGAMTQYFPLSLGLGLTRREFLVGTSVVFLATAALYAIVITLLNWLEVATNGYGLHVRMFDVVWVGMDSPWRTLVQTFLLLCAFLFLGAASATVVKRFGQLVLWLVIGVGVLAVVIGSSAVTLAGSWPEVAAWVVDAQWGLWMSLLALLALVGAAAWVLLVRRAPVR